MRSVVSTILHNSVDRAVAKVCSQWFGIGVCSGRPRGITVEVGAVVGTATIHNLNRQASEQRS